VTLTRTTLSQVGPGVRAGFTVAGPRAETFVDKANCTVVTP
jgi:hypothetical protein